MHALSNRPATICRAPTNSFACALHCFFKGVQLSLPFPDLLPDRNRPTRGAILSQLLFSHLDHALGAGNLSLCKTQPLDQERQKLQKRACHVLGIVLWGWLQLHTAVATCKKQANLHDAKICYYKPLVAVPGMELRGNSDCSMGSTQTSYKPVTAGRAMMQTHTC